MTELLVVIFLLVLVLFVGFAVIGLGVSIAWIGKQFNRDTNLNAQRRREVPTFQQDVEATERVLSHLLSTEKITPSFYKTLSEILSPPAPIQADAIASPENSTDEEIQTETIFIIDDDPAISEVPTAKLRVEPPSTSSYTTEQPEQTVRTSDSLVAVELVNPPADDGAAKQFVNAQVTMRQSPPVVSHQKKRSFAEVMSGFMQEKNMRWGELTSGILIVLSAVGLVVSLRDQLSNTIPYFSSILFMLITGAIIGAGIYTLKKWKLRNTSRGTLVIGLLLVPLNFVAACVLTGGTGRRDITDPTLWIALTLGFACFSTLTWFGCKFLLRTQYWKLFCGIIGCCLSAIVINRVFDPNSSSLHYLVLSVLPVLCFLIGSGVSPHPKLKSARSRNQLYLNLGISSFAIFCALSLYFIRSDSIVVTAVNLMPAFILVSLVLVWHGQNILQSIKQQNNIEPQTRLIGLSLHILGLILAGLLLAIALSNPTIFVFCCVLIATGLLLMVWRSSLHLLPIIWIVCSSGILVGMNLILGVFQFDQWTSTSQLTTALISGESGLCLLGCGIVILLIQPAIGLHFKDAASFSTLKRQGLFTAVGTIITGSLIALAASLVNRHDLFDTMSASLLLLSAAAGTLIVILRLNLKRFGLANKTHSMLLANLGAGLLLIALAHVLLWNPLCFDWVNQLAGNIHSNWIWVFGLHGLVLAAIAVWMFRFVDSKVLELWAMVSTTLSVVGALTAIQHQTGVAVVIVGLATLAWWLLGLSLSRHFTSLNIESRSVGIPFVAMTGLLLFVFIAERMTLYSWCPGWFEPRFWIIQMIGFSIWVAIWTIVAELLRRNDEFSWLVYASPRVDQIVGLMLVIGLAGLITTGLYNGVTSELFKNVGQIEFSLAIQQPWVVAAIIAISAALVLSFIELPTRLKGVAAIVVWMLACAFAASLFENSRSSASALRWTMPIGGLALAILVAARRPLIPAWSRLRTRLNLIENPSWNSRWTQDLINLALLIVVTTVLAISTVTLAQVMLNGADALGGPLPESLFGKMDKVISFGLPLGILVSTFLLYAISERRPWLATAGSAVFQYMVIVAIVLLFLSPHPKLASAWFIRILQAVSLGMTVYGFVWFLLQKRINSSSTATRRPRISQIEVHTLINGALVTSFSALVYVRYFFVPDQSGDWINSVSSPLGIIAWLLYVALAFCVWRSRLSNQKSVSIWLCLSGWTGLVLTAMVASIVDYQLQISGFDSAWVAYKCLCFGTVLTLALQLVHALIVRNWLSSQSGVFIFDNGQFKVSHQALRNLVQGNSVPLIATALIAFLFTFQGASTNPNSFWLFLGLFVSAKAILFFGGLWNRNNILLAASVFASFAVTTLLVNYSPLQFSPHQPNWLNVATIVTGLMAITNLAFYIYYRRVLRMAVDSSFVVFPNLFLVTAVVWIFVGSTIESGCGFEPLVGVSSIANPLGVFAVVTTGCLILLSLWNEHRRLWVFNASMTSISLAMIIASVVTNEIDYRIACVLFGVSVVAGLWGVSWLSRRHSVRIASRIKIYRTSQLLEQAEVQLPVYMVPVSTIIVAVSSIAIFTIDQHLLRFAVGVSPLLLAFGFGAFSASKNGSWIRYVSLSCLGLGLLFSVFAIHSPTQLISQPLYNVLLSSLFVFTLLVLGFGSIAIGWKESVGTWFNSLRDLAAAVLALAILGFGALIMQEAIAFDTTNGSGLSLSSSLAVIVGMTGLICSLVLIAVNPQLDPYSLSERNRESYVYVAQLILACVLIHIYLAMPWLFKSGISQFWPYIAVAISFGGIGISKILETRNLNVLSRPLFSTFATIPLLAVAGLTVFNSKADSSIVLLSAGLLYLLVGYLRRSVLSGLIAIALGNLALWMFYGKFPQFSFVAHPQLWLIPPALSVLVASHICRSSFSSSHLAAIRYICMAIIYISSTGEIFISGLGDHLWPPMVLALLAVAGIMAGILFQIRSYLYLGSLFLLMAMISMVAHAHQRFEHVWPWWAFGVTLGIAILVLFGLFEKRKNEVKSLAGRFQKWQT